MTQDDVIHMAQEAGLVRFEGGELEAYGIAEASHDDHSRAYWRIADEHRLKRFAALVAAAEREECATICGAISSAAEINEMSCDEDKIEFYSSRHLAADDCADLIRARGKA
jgi:hypothetical protein